MWWKKSKAKWLSREGLAQATGVAAYVWVFSQLMINGSNLFPHINKTWGPMMFLILFCFSVLACGLTVFYKPYLLFVDRKGKEAVALVVATTKWLGIFAGIVIVLVAMMSR